jgi:transcriptional regulator
MSNDEKAPSKSDLLQGTLDMLILKTLALDPHHGWGIAQRIQQISKDVLQVNQGSLYPALHRLEIAGWIASEWGASENNRRAKFYRLTATGRRHLKEETENWTSLRCRRADPRDQLIGRCRALNGNVPQEPLPPPRRHRRTPALRAGSR